MNYQKIEVKYRKESHVFNVKVIESLQALRFAIGVTFDQLPANYEIHMDDQLLSEQQYLTIKQIQFNGFILQIKGKDYDLQSLKSDMSRIQIMGDSKIKSERSQKFKQQALFEQKDNNLLRQLQKEVQPKSKLVQNEVVLNEDIQCNGCFAFPIKGVIYKCMVCQDYDLCSSCQKTKHQFHPLLKITQKDTYPIKLQVSFSKQSQCKMQKLAKLDQINQQRIKKAKYHRQVKEYSIIDPSELKTKKIVAPNFLSEIIGNKY